MSLTVKKNPLTCLNTNIGELCLFSIRYKDSMEFLKRLNSPMEEIGSLECFKTYLPLFAYLQKDLESPNFERPEEYLLQTDDIEKLSDQDLEEIAKIIVEDNSYLYKEHKTAQSKKEDGTVILKIQQSDEITIPQNPGESYVEYFHRLLIERAKKDKEQFKKMASSFSTGLSEDILKTLNIGKTLTDQISAISKIPDYLKVAASASYEDTNVVPANFKISYPQHDIAESIARNERLQEERRLAPFKDLSSKMEAMIDAEKETVEFMSSVYATQVEIANELKSSSDSAGAYAKKNMLLTYLIIFLTFISIFVAAYPVWFDKKGEETLQASKDLNSTIAQTNVKLEELIRVMSAQNDAKDQEIQKLQKELQIEKEKNVKMKAADK